jgi:hypothetical protein
MIKPPFAADAAVSDRLTTALAKALRIALHSVYVIGGTMARTPKDGIAARKLVSLRIPPALYARLEAASADFEPPHTLSEVIVERLSYSFEMDDCFGAANTRALLRLIFEITKGARETTGLGWRENAFTYNLAVEAIHRLLQMLRPAGSGEPPESFPTFAPWMRQAVMRSFHTDGPGTVRAFALPLAHNIMARLLDAGGGRDEFASWVGQQAASIGTMLESEIEGTSGEADADDRRRLYRAIADALGAVAQKAVVPKRPKKQRRSKQ